MVAPDRASVPSWRETLARLRLVGRAQVVSPIVAAARERKRAFAERAIGERHAALARAEATKAEAARRSAQRKRSIYAGAAINRLNADWVLGPLSADLAIRGDLRALRDRARQLFRDNAYAARYVRLAVENIIGADGVRVSPSVLVPDGTLDGTTNAVLADAWRRWSEQASVDGRSWREIEQLAVTVWKAEGEFLAYLTPARNAFGFAIQVLDNDQLDHEFNRTAGTGENEVRMGVEVDEWQRPVAYHLWTAHPSEPHRGRIRVRVPAEQIIHLAEFERPLQTRGVTRFATVMTTLNMLGGLQEAVLVLQRTASCKMGFLTVDPEQTSALEGEDGDQETAVSWDAEPGRIEQLPKGMEFTAWDPGQPGNQYDPFTKNVLRECAAGLNIAYSSLTGDLSQANYGSQRGGLLSERDGWRRDQRLVIERLHRPVYAAFLKYGLLRGAFLRNGRPLPFDPVLFGAVHFEPRGFDWIDPRADIDAALAEVGAGLNSLTAICAAKGRDFETILRQRKHETDLAEQYGVTLTLGIKNALPLAPIDDTTGGEAHSTDNGDQHADASSGRALVAVR